MKWKLLKKRVLPIGIDLGTAAAKLVQLTVDQQQTELTAAGYLAVPDELRGDLNKRLDFFGGQLGAIVRGGGFQGRKAILSLPPACTFLEHLKTARGTDADVAKALRWELEGKLPFSTSDAVIRHLVAGEAFTESGAGLEVIVVAVQRRVVDDHLAMAARAGLQVAGLNIEPCAILECFARLFRRSADAGRVTMFLDLGQAFSQVVIAHGPKLVFARNIPFGANQIDQAMAAGLKMPAGEVAALRRRLVGQPDSRETDFVYDALRETLDGVSGELNKCLRYYESVFPSSPVEQSIFLGGQAQDRRLCQQLAQRLNLPAQVGDPLARITRGPDLPDLPEMDRREAQPAWAVAVGLSLGAGLSQAA